jgi:hypothetical protein
VWAIHLIIPREKGYELFNATTFLSHVGCTNKLATLMAFMLGGCDAAKRLNSMWKEKDGTAYPLSKSSNKLLPLSLSKGVKALIEAEASLKVGGTPPPTDAAIAMEVLSKNYMCESNSKLQEKMQYIYGKLKALNDVGELESILTLFNRPIVSDGDFVRFAFLPLTAPAYDHKKDQVRAVLMT